MTSSDLVHEHEQLSDGFSPKQALRTLAATLCLMGALYAAYYLPQTPGSWPDRIISSYLAAMARGVGTLVSFVDPTAKVSGTQVRGGFVLEVVKDCSALDAQALLAGAILGSSGRWRPKLTGVAAGTLILGLVNLLRMSCLYVIGLKAPGVFDSIHEEVMPLLLVAVATACFLAWIRWAGITGAKGPRHATS